MGSCLNTKLKENVNNDNLEKLGTLNWVINTAINNKDGIAVMYNDGSHLNTQFEITSGDLVINNVQRDYLLGCVGSGIVEIKNKYHISQLALYRGTIKLESLEFSPITSLEVMRTVREFGFSCNTEEINKYTPNIQRLVVDGEGALISGPVILLPNSLTYLAITSNGNYGVTGSMSDLAIKENITTLNIFDNKLLTGTVEDFVAVRKALKNQTSGSVALKTTNSPITFIDSIKGDSTLTWEPSGDNTRISFNGSETIINIASDGTWSRVS